MKIICAIHGKAGEVIVDIPTMASKRRALSLILKCIVVLSAAVGVYLSRNAGFVAFMGGDKVFMYFTIQSNIAIALVCAVGAVLLCRRAAVHNAWFIIKYVGTVAITVTGAVFTFVLAPTLGEKAWNARNILTHLIVPAASIADFFVTGVFGDIRKKHIPLVTLPLIAYLIYAGIGCAAGWEFSPGNNYPYFFLNWGSPAGAFGFTDRLPYMGCVWWIMVGMVLVLGIGLIYVLILNRIKRKLREIV